MSAISACLCWTLLSVCLLASSSAGQTNVTADPGQNVSLPCKALNNDPVKAVEWSRTDRNPEEELLSYRNKMFYPDYQHPSYQNRVDLQDRQMKDGDVSLILKNVKTEDSGTYECYVVQTKSNRRKRAVPVKSTIIIRLDVVPPGGHQGDGDKDGRDQAGLSRGHPGLIAGVVAVVGVVMVVSLITVRHMKKKSSPPSSSSSPPEQSADHLLV